MADDKDKKYVKRGKQKTRVSPKLRKTDILYIFDATDDDIASYAELFAKYVLNLTNKKKIKGIGSWEALAGELKKYRKINRLIFHAHGAPGQLIINGVNHGIGEPVVQKLFKKVIATVDQIEFENCNIAQDAQAMVDFAKLFSAKKVSGWTRYMLMASFDITIPMYNTKKDLEKIFKPYQPYLAPGMPTASKLASTAKRSKQTYKLLLTWFRVIGLTGLPPMGRGERYFSGRERTWLPRNSAAKRVIKSADAPSVSKDFSTRIGGPFQHITVTIP